MPLFFKENIEGLQDPVIVFTTDKPYEAEIICGLLREYGISSYLITTGREKDLMLPVMKIFEPDNRDHYHVYVSRIDEKVAIDVLKSRINESGVK